MSTKHNFFYTTIHERFPLTKKGSSKTTYHIVLKHPPISYKVGDSIALIPQNDPDLVNEILHHLKASGDESVQDKKGNTYPLKQLLLEKANLAKITPSLRSHLTDQPVDANEDLLSLLEKGSKAPPSLSTLTPLLLPQMPRFYSIASSPLVFPDEIHLTVALLSYSQGGRTRYGVASHFLCHLAHTHTPILSYVHPSSSFTLPSNPSLPIILIGPGTGVAPFRAFLQERVYQKASGLNWLFFGERQSAYDFYYEEEFMRYVKEGKLRLTTAFSRDQPEKIYVQHKIEEHKKELFKKIQEGALIYVCGDAKEMARDVETAFRSLLREEGALTEEAAADMIKQLKKEKRYLLDVY